uniref:Uncharacterized protein n=1 Tax=Clytia hemisphaerica TaxID=252671 RepID=A0A7M5UEL2_9CNID
RNPKSQRTKTTKAINKTQTDKETLPDKEIPNDKEPPKGKRKRTKKVVRMLSISMATLKPNCSQILENALKFSVDDKINNLKRSGKTFGNFVREATQVLLSAKTKDFDDLAYHVVEDMFALIS